MGMKTGIVPAAILAALASYLSDSLGLTPELAATVVFLGAVVVLWLIPDDIEAKLMSEARKLMGLGPLVLIVALAGCTFSAPSWREGELIQAALLDRLPGADQQHETSTVTGFSLRDLTIGMGTRDVTRQPVSNEPLYGAGIRRTQTVRTGLGDELDSDLTSGEAFENTGTAEGF